MNRKPNLLRTAEELTAYAVERQIGFERHQGSRFRQPEERNQWIRGILGGMAELFDAAPDTLLRLFAQRLEDARGCFAVEPLTLTGQTHTVQSLRWYTAQLEHLDSDQRGRVFEVKNLLEDMTAYLGWDVSRTGVYPARDEAEETLLRLTARRPIRFTRVLLGGDFDPGGAEFVSGLVWDTEGVRNTQMFQYLTKTYPCRKDWPAICRVCLCGGRDIALDIIDADGLDMSVIREAGDRFLKRPGVKVVGSKELHITVQRTANKSQKRKGPER